MILEQFVNLLLKWNEKINLIGRKSANLIWQNHVLPSAQLAEYITEQDPVILDVGSGAGFPGVVLSIVKGWSVILVERSKKKCIFLKEAQKLTNANFVVENATIEETNNFSPDIITSRGVTNIREFLKLVDCFLNDKVKIMLMKGDKCQDEIKDSQGGAWQFDYDIKDKIKGNTIVILYNFRKL